MPGLLIETITTGGQADKAGLRPHDVLYRYNNHAVNAPEDLVEATRSDKAENKLGVIRCRDMLEVIVPPGPLGLTVQPFPVRDLHIEGAGEVFAKMNLDADKSEVIARAEHQSIIDAVALTTSFNLEGWRIVRTLGIVTSESVLGINIFRDIVAGLTDLVGGNSKSMRNILREARDTCLSGLKAEAHALGANAVIAVDLDYSEISGGGKSMIFLVASGTAVMVEKNPG